FWTLGVFQLADSLEAACGVLAKRTMPVVARPNRWTGFALGICLWTKRRRVFSRKPPPGRVGSPLGLLTANRSGSSNRTSKCWGQSGSIQGGRFQTRVWPTVTDSLPLAVTPLRVTSPLFSFSCQACRFEWGYRFAKWESRVCPWYLVLMIDV